MHGLFRIPLAQSAFRPIEVGEHARPPCSSETRVEGIRNILRQAGITLAQLAAITGKRYGRTSPYFIPPSFLYKLKNGITPHICQIVALSEITGYRFVDWTQICGFDLRHILRLQLRLHHERTVLVTPIEFEAGRCRPHRSILAPAVGGSSMRLGQNEENSSLPVGGRDLFAKIGSADASTNPNLTRGSVVRVNRSYCQPPRHPQHTSTRSLLWLVEQPRGLTCCHVNWIGDQQIILLPIRPPWGAWPLRVPTEARILGLVDMKLGSVNEARLHPGTLPTMRTETAVPFYEQQTARFSELLRISRRRTGLTFRAAHRLTEAIAHTLEDRKYAISLGLLSDYEAMSRLPRHIEKVISLCIIYCIDIRQLMESADVNIDDSSKIPLPILHDPVTRRPDFMDTEPYRTIGMGA